MSEIYFEYVVQGAYVKVSAIEPETKTEAVVVLPKTLSEEQMKFQALQKLNYVLKKQAEEILHQKNSE
ncbi:MAG: hypothetical protein IJ545_01310 [Alphaproteobacteria bacterium]|nr:hypothetical protein [Alphaproteobacteria bacterium]